MNRNELVERIASENDVSKTLASAMLTSFTSAVVEAVSEGDTVQIIGFGSFKSTERAARIGRNPRTGEDLEIAASTAPRFVAGKAFKDAVNSK